jgi:hypothetical protein
LAKELWKFSLQIVSSWCARFSLKQCFASETLFEARPPCSSFFFGKVENGIADFAEPSEAVSKVDPADWFVDVRSKEVIYGTIS